MLLPLLAVSIITSVTIHQAIDITDDIVEHSITEMHQAMALQLRIAQASMPPNDYLIHANPMEQDNARSANAIVEQEFNNIFSIKTWAPDQLDIINESRQGWLKARQLSDTIMQLENPIGSRRGSVLMEQYDAQIDGIVNLLKKLHLITNQKTEENHAKLHTIKSQSPMIMLFITITGLLIALAGSMLVIRAVFPALKQLEQGIGLFSKGSFEQRVDSNMPLELQRVAAGLNDMAAKLQISYAELEKQSMQDALTGAYNKRKFVIEYGHETIRARRYKQAFSLLLIDLDHFKLVNDTYGHPTGDVVLQKVVQRINLQLRTSDSLYRYGGEEFTILLPETDEGGALTLAERICRSVAGNPIHINGDETISITVSIGIAVYPQHGDNEGGLIVAADDAVYEAKNGGRNRACIAKATPGLTVVSDAGKL